MPESTEDIFLKIAEQRGLLDADAVELVRGLKRLDAMRARRRKVERICVKERLLSVEQVRGLMRGVRYYVTRKADRHYGRIARLRTFVTEETLAAALEEQKRLLRTERRLVRLRNLLLARGDLRPEQDEVVQVLLRQRSPRISARVRSGRSSRRSSRRAPAAAARA